MKKHVGLVRRSTVLGIESQGKAKLSNDAILGQPLQMCWNLDHPMPATNNVSKPIFNMPIQETKRLEKVEVKGTVSILLGCLFYICIPGFPHSTLEISP